MDAQTQLAIYRAMVTARWVDRLEEELVTRGEAFFMVAGGGHEGGAALVPHLVEHDWLSPHYRDKAMMIARGVTPADFFRGLLCKGTSSSAGRQMSAHLSDPSLNMLSLSGPVGNDGLHATGVAMAVKDQPQRPVVLCALGEGTTQEGEMLEAFGEAVRWNLPVLFLVHDNEFAISTHTPGKTFYSTPDGVADTFMGRPVEFIDGWDVPACHAKFGEVVARMREDRKPAFLVFKANRLTNHTNADDQRVYRSEEELAQARAAFDPIKTFRAWILGQGAVSETQLEEIESSVEASVRATAESVLDEPEPEAEHGAKKELPARLADPASEYLGDPDATPRLTMIEAMRKVLRQRLGDDDRVCLYGQDLEDPKGDVFGLTKGLSTEYPGRVLNSPLAEASIIGACVGRALAGQRPVAFLQFADFFPIAYNQIISELGSMHWRSNGAWQSPVIVMVTCGGFRPGLGPFHAQSFEAVAAHTPGVDVYMPATAYDAAGMLNAAFDSGRPAIFFYPKSCLNDRSATTSGDVARQMVPPGRARIARAGDDATIVAWGNTVPISLKCAERFAAAGVECEVIDLRTISPWDADAVVASAEKTGRLLVVHEDNITCGFGAEVLATVAERARRPIAMKRIARSDTFVPCNFGNQLEILPSQKRVLEEAAPFLGLSLKWDLAAAAEGGIYTMDAIGSSPSDESITVTEWLVKEGDAVKPGQLVAECEADKAIFELTAPVEGVVVELVAPAGQMVKVGAPIMKLQSASAGRQRQPKTPELAAEPLLSRVDAPAGAPAPAVRRAVDVDVALSPVRVKLGSRIVDNEEAASWPHDLSPTDIFERTGIEQRRWLAEGETILDLAVDVAAQTLDEEGLALSELDAIIVSTGTPPSITPSLACRVLERLQSAGGRPGPALAAWDVNAACSGYLYALGAAYDWLGRDPSARILVITAEHLSQFIDKKDYGTAIVFGDGASATLVANREGLSSAWARVERPVLCAWGDDGSNLYVPGPGSGGCIAMQGKKVFAEAVKKMTEALGEACARSGLAVQDLDLVIPHQANQRIIDAVMNRARVAPDRMFSSIRMHGNVSSTTIPLCLSQLQGNRAAGEKYGLAVFGGGFTYGAGLIEHL